MKVALSLARRQTADIIIVSECILIVQMTAEGDMRSEREQLDVHVGHSQAD